MKKGQYEGIGIVFAILLLTLIIFIAMLLFVANRGKIGEEKLNSIKISENNLLLLNYLRTPVIYEGEDILMSDLIVLKNKNKIEEESKNILDKYCTSKCVWKLTLNYENDNIIITSNSVTDFFVVTSSNEFNLTSFGENILIKLEMGYNERIKGYSKLRY